MEDTALPTNAPYAFELAVERIRAASAAARALPHDFVLVARADGVMNGTYDLEEGLRRIRAFDAAGADCLYIPCPSSPEDLRIICAATSKPVNALAFGAFTKLSQVEFGKLGVARISLGSSLARATHKLIHDAAAAMFEDGNFKSLSQGISGTEIDAAMAKGAARPS